MDWKPKEAGEDDGLMTLTVRRSCSFVLRHQVWAEKWAKRGKANNSQE